MKTHVKYLVFALTLVSCGEKEKRPGVAVSGTIQVSEPGTKIVFTDSQAASFFAVEDIGNSELTSKVSAPAKIAATVVSSEQGASQNVMLFENPELAGCYTQLLQHIINVNQIQNINIKQKEIELNRIKDLQQHGVASSKDLLEAQTMLSMEQTNLANEKAGIIEHETKLKAAGFKPEMLRKAQPGEAYIICEIPENEISKVKIGSDCEVEFPSYPNEIFKGNLSDIADVVDNATRMAKILISLHNADNRLKAGMFATVSFGINEGKNLSVNQSAVITVQGRNYVFVKTGPLEFERKEVSIGSQIGDRIIVFSGLAGKEHVVIKGVMQLKGLSFGY